jgi:methyl-accepting chemotaxis protein
MNSWTISRRIIVGFATLVLITVALGVFALWRLMGIAEDAAYLADNTLPSVLLLREVGNLSRDNLIAVLQIDPAGPPERNAQLEDRISANAARGDELIKNYEVLLSDDEDRRLYEEIKRTRDIVIASRTRALELLKQNKVEEFRQLQTGVLVPDYEKHLKAIDLDVQYNEKLGKFHAETGKTSAIFSVRLIGICLFLAFLLASLLAWMVVRSTNRALRNIMANLDRGAVETASAARQVSMASQTLASGASEQASSVEETSTSLEEMSSMVGATAENARKAKELASEARLMAETGAKTMAEMTDAMAAIDSSSAEVAKIVKNIDEIAFQTNILALNAAVEAARAGEAGAGFAVVADEVRSLAQRSAAAAKETADKIEVSMTNSQRGSECTAKVEKSLTHIAEKVISTDLLVAEIATAAREQAQGIDQINAAIGQLDKVSQSNSASAEESASAAEELDAQAETLKDQVARLRQLVGGDSAALSAPPVSSARLLPARSTPAITDSKRRTIPMPGDSESTVGTDNFRDF